MKSNVGLGDKIIRILIAVVIAVLIFIEILTGIWAIILGIFGGIMLVTAVVGFCGLYTVFGINTCPAKKKEQ